MSREKLTRSERREKAKRQQRMQSIGIVILGVLIIVIAVVLINALQPGLEVAEEYDYSLANGNAIGDPNAPVKLEVFSSFSCIHCKNFAVDTEHQVIENYVKTGQVYYIYRAFNDPRGAVGVASQAAYCAGDQGKFWEMHDIIFANFSQTGYSVNELRNMAELIGLDTDVYDTCLDTEKYVDAIIDDATIGREAGVTGTPSFTINGVMAIEGNRDFAGIQLAIEAELARLNN
jgi:protein-disulfide isomerase